MSDNTFKSKFKHNFPFQKNTKTIPARAFLKLSFNPELSQCNFMQVNNTVCPRCKENITIEFYGGWSKQCVCSGCGLELYLSYSIQDNALAFLTKESNDREMERREFAKIEDRFAALLKNAYREELGKIISNIEKRQDEMAIN